MPWYLLITGVAGGLLLIFALVEWLLLGLEQNSDRRSRVVGFVLGGCACLVGTLVAWVIPQEAVAQPAAASEAAAAVALLERHYEQELQLIRRVAGGTIEPALNTIISARQQLYEARMELAHDPSLQTNADLLEVRGKLDTLLGVARHTLGSQWTAAKTGTWNTAEARNQVLDQLQRELNKWEEFRTCMRSASDCLPDRTLTDRQKQIRELSVWLHPYYIELSRFQETEPELVDSSATEFTRLRQLFAQARAGLQQRSPEPWAREILKAAESLFQSADQALALEAAARRQGTWHPATQAQTYTRVYAAFDDIVMAMAKASR